MDGYDTGRDGGQAGITRITYLGGILLPFTAVATILSMSSPFAPDGSLFWVFWAVSVPLTVCTIFMIYADDIRRLEVWVEVSAENLQEVAGRDAAVLADDDPAVRPAKTKANKDKSDDGYEHQTTIRVGTAARGQAPAYRELTEVAPGTAASAPTAGSTESVPASEKPATSVTVRDDDDVQEIVLEVVGARRRQRRRFCITNPLGGPHAQVYTQTAPRTSEQAQETVAQDVPEDDIVFIHMYSRSRSRSPEWRPQGLWSERRQQQPGLGWAAPAAHSLHTAAAAHLARPMYVMQQAADGARARAWRRQQLGWFGAAGSLFGYQRAQHMREMPAGTAAVRRLDEKTRAWKAF